MTKEEIAKLSEYQLVRELQRHLKRKPVIELKEYFNHPVIDSCFEEIYRRFQKPLMFYCSRLVYDKDALDDIFHEIFINVYLNIHRFRFKKTFNAWIYRIAHNVSINFLKKHGHNEKLIINNEYADGLTGLEYLEFRMMENESTVEKYAITRELREKIDMVFKKLDHDSKAVFLLKNEFNFTFDEIAEIIGMSSRHVKSKYRQIADIFKNELDKLQINRGHLD
ncbi:MAG: hypothetical protein A2096_17205 [Spirochaetes bacterium GWF1_41_5]|nr:MAG: hypothetical protein A2096_17205 [Spirochaetes bacterium GWF1_41_5]HBE04447.1 hypothetical protein [Spirochaetia bacterium]